MYLAVEELKVREAIMRLGVCVWVVLGDLLFSWYLSNCVSFLVSEMGWPRSAEREGASVR